MMTIFELNKMDTVIAFNSNEEKAYCCSIDSETILQWYKIIDAHPDEVDIICGNENILEVYIPKQWVKIKSPHRVYDTAEIKRLKEVFDAG